jgi:hypothetical protein
MVWVRACDGKGGEEGGDRVTATVRLAGPMTLCARPPLAAVESLDSPFRSEKGLFQEIDGEWRRCGESELR